MLHHNVVQILRDRGVSKSLIDFYLVAFSTRVSLADFDTLDDDYQVAVAIEEAIKAVVRRWQDQQ